MFGEIVPRGSSSKTSTLQLRAEGLLDAKEEYFGTTNIPAARRPFRRNSLRSIMLHPMFQLLTRPLQQRVRTWWDFKFRASSTRRRLVEWFRLHVLRGFEAVDRFEIVSGQHP